MNASLQCLTHLPLLSDYFRNSEDWRRDLNVEAKEGAKGEVAAAFEELLRRVAVLPDENQGYSTSSVVAPARFKRVLETFRPVFKGWQQQDAHEFVLAVILGLGEDLNRVEGDKPYTEQADSDGRSDVEVAEEWWKSWNEREKSVITALFGGQEKSMLECEAIGCSHTSTRFQAFNGAIPVEIPEETDFSMRVKVVLPTSSVRLIGEDLSSSSTSLSNPLSLEYLDRVECAVRVPRSGTVGDALQALRALSPPVCSAIEPLVLVRLGKNGVFVDVFDTQIPLVQIVKPGNDSERIPTKMDRDLYAVRPLGVGCRRVGEAEEEAQIPLVKKVEVGEANGAKEEDTEEGESAAAAAGKEYNADDDDEVEEEDVSVLITVMWKRSNGSIDDAPLLLRIVDPAHVSGRELHAAVARHLVGDEGVGEEILDRYLDEIGITLKVTDKSGALSPHSHWLARSDGTLIPRSAEDSVLALWPTHPNGFQDLTEATERKYLVVTIASLKEEEESSSFAELPSVATITVSARSRQQQQQQRRLESAKAMHVPLTQLHCSVDERRHIDQLPLSLEACVRSYCSVESMPAGETFCPKCTRVCVCVCLCVSVCVCVCVC